MYINTIISHRRYNNYHNIVLASSGTEPQESCIPVLVIAASCLKTGLESCDLSYPSNNKMVAYNRERGLPLTLFSPSSRARNTFWTFSGVALYPMIPTRQIFPAWAPRPPDISTLYLKSESFTHVFTKWKGRHGASTCTCNCLLCTCLQVTNKIYTYIYL